jgi:hypothetical protein
MLEGSRSGWRWQAYGLDGYRDIVERNIPNQAASPVGQADVEGRPDPASGRVKAIRSRSAEPGAIFRLLIVSTTSRISG